MHSIEFNIRWTLQQLLDNFFNSLFELYETNETFFGEIFSASKKRKKLWIVCEATDGEQW